MLEDLRKSGCRVRISGNHFTISNIPDWKTYRYCQKNLKKLMLIALAEHIFKDPPRPIKFDKTRDSRCPHCKHYNTKRCHYKLNSHLIPPGTIKKGCELWVESKSIFF